MRDFPLAKPVRFRTVPHIHDRRLGKLTGRSWATKTHFVIQIAKAANDEPTCLTAQVQALVDEWCHCLRGHEFDHDPVWNGWRTLIEQKYWPDNKEA